MKQGWEIKKLREVCKLTNGYAFQSKDYIDDGYFVIRIGNVQEGYIELNNPRYIQLSEDKQKKFILSEGDILVSLTGNVGRVGEIKVEHLPAVLNQRVAKISLNSKSILKAYLFYFLTSEYFITELIKAGRGAAQQNISTTDIENLIIPLPPLPEQQRIVSLLDEAFAAIAKAKANAEQNLKNAKELFESYLQGVFENKGDGWELCRLEDICTIQLGKTPYRKNPKFWDKNKISGNVWLSIADMKHGAQISDSEEQISDLGAKGIVKIPKDTLLVSFKLTLGRVSFTGCDLFTNEAIAALLNLDGKILKYFLFYYFSYLDWGKMADGDIKVKGKTLNKQKLKGLPIYIPPVQEQAHIVKKLDALRAETQKLEALYQKKIDDFNKLKKSILQKAFAGELKDSKIKT